jgi:hypothetical protein
MRPKAGEAIIHNSFCTPRASGPVHGHGWRRASIPFAADLCWYLRTTAIPVLFAGWGLRLGLLLALLAISSCGKPGKSPPEPQPPSPAAQVTVSAAPHAPLPRSRRPATLARAHPSPCRPCLQERHSAAMPYEILELAGPAVRYLHSFAQPCWQPVSLPPPCRGGRRTPCARCRAGCLSHPPTALPPVSPHRRL